MEYIKEEYFFDEKAKMIYKKSIVTRKKVGELEEAEVLELLRNEEPEIYIHSEGNKIQCVEKTERSALIVKLKNHINTWANQKEYDSFKNGYCYFAELWKMKEGKKLILLYYRH